MQVIATGKWSKALKRWSMVVSLRRPPQRASTNAPAVRPGKRPGPRTED